MVELRHGHRVFEILDWREAEAGAATADRGSVLALLRDAVQDGSGTAELRALLSDESPGQDLSRLSDEDVLAQLADLLECGRVRILERTPALPTAAIAPGRRERPQPTRERTRPRRRRPTVPVAPVAPVAEEVPKVAMVRLFLDENRDGDVDQAAAACADWTLGPDGAGAIVLPRTLAYAEGSDVLERTPLELKFDGGQPFPEAWTATLSAAPQDRIRIYDRRAHDEAEQVLGKDSAAELALHEKKELREALKRGDTVRLWVEAVDVPASARKSDWLVELSLRFTADGEEDTQSAQVCIAPWIMASDLDATEKLFILDFARSGPATKIKNGPIVLLNRTLISEVATEETERVAPDRDNDNRYLRDAMRFGHLVAPGVDAAEERTLRVALRSNCTATQRGVPDVRIDRGDREIGLLDRGRACSSNYQTGGNMVVTPPTERHPWGRILCGGVPRGDDVLGPWEDLLKAQRLQEPLKIDTSWLSVGHADEIVGFVPKVEGSAAGGKDFRMLLASPRRAYELLFESSASYWDEYAETYRAQHVKDRQYQTRWKAALPDSLDFAERRGGEWARADNGEGRIAFSRFSLNGDPRQYWRGSFFATDPLLLSKLDLPTDALRNAHLDGLEELWNVEFQDELEQTFLELREEQQRPQEAALEPDVPQEVAPDAEPAPEEDVEGAPPPPPPLVMDEPQAESPETRRARELHDLILRMRAGGGFVGLAQNEQSTLRKWLTRHMDDLQARPETDDYAQRVLGLCYLTEIDSLGDLCAARALLEPCGHDVLEALPLPAALEDTSKELWERLERDVKAPGDPAQPAIAELSNDVADELDLDRGRRWNSLQDVNMIVQAKLDVIRATLKNTLGLADEDIIDVPLLYTDCMGAETIPADMVNLVLLNEPADPEATDEAPQPSRGCRGLVPKPFGPIVDGVDVFEKDFRERLEALDITVTFVDEWYEYHVNNGELHCGTNQLPKRVSKKWWEQASAPWLDG